MAKNAQKVTPMIQQYLDIKEAYPDAILFFRVGDFYEMFFEDAETAAKELDIVLTKRSVDKNDPDPIPLAGIPFHACETYIRRLLEKGYKIAVCEQVEDPQKAKGIVKREVVQLITPGTVLDTNFLNEKENNFLVSLAEAQGRFGLAVVDVSTGDFLVTEFQNHQTDQLFDELARISPQEIIVDENCEQIYRIATKFKNYGILVTPGEQPSYQRTWEILTEQMNVESLEGFGLKNARASIVAGGFLLRYLKDTQKTELAHIQKVKPYATENYLIMDANTRKNLELSETIRSRQRHGSLLWVLDKTNTAMGGRQLKHWIQQPLVEVEAIQERQTYIEGLVQEYLLREELARALSEIYDLERVMSRIIYDRATPKDLIALSKSLAVIPEIKETLCSGNQPQLIEYAQALPDLEDTVELIHKAIVPDPPHTIREGGIINYGFDEKLDELRQMARGGKEWISALENREKERTGIKSLKVRYNKVFGYYIEVTKKNIDMVPDDYVRKQTLVNAERYITPELKEYEDKVLNAEAEIAELEYRLFQDVRAKVIDYINEIQQTAKLLAFLDCYLSLAKTAVEYDYVRPEVDDTNRIAIHKGRHPVVERVSHDEPFVPNDTYLDNSTEQISLITGPNMAGKSTYMRQVALIILMAQIGAFVPAKHAKIGVVDKIFTRVGAADDLVGGQSTFMVEMNEVANILNNATSKSFVLLDEVGRGTSTFDGISIARAVVEYLHQESKVACKTLFATHFHELIELGNEFSRVVNYSVSVKEKDDKMIFLREIERGGTDKSYGVQVAKLAGLPQPVIRRAKEILAYLENRSTTKEVPITGVQVTLEDITREEMQLLRELSDLDIDHMTPLEALEKLYELKQKAREQLES